MPRPKLKFEEAWKWAGGNPEMLARLHQTGWKIEEAAETLVEKRKLRLFASSLSDEEKTRLLETVEDPDTLFARAASADGQACPPEPHRRQHRREGKLVLDRRAAARKRFGARGRQTRSVADTAAQGSGEESAKAS